MPRKVSKEAFIRTLRPTTSTTILGTAVAAGQELGLPKRMGDVFAELDEDLWPYVTYVGEFFMIHHPLVISIPHLPGMGEFVNKQFHQKRHMVRSAEQGHAPASYVFAHERPYRAEALRRVADWDADISNHHWWKTVRDTWMDSENIHQHIKIWDELFLGTKCHRVSSRPYFMNMGELEDMQNVFKTTDRIRIFRGASEPEYATLGFSWTTDKELAKWFATRFSQVGYVAESWTTQQDILAMVQGRDGPEVVAAPFTFSVKEVAR